ncbi:MAG: serine hydrolase, partial [Pseudomonadota bacterium]
MLRNRSLLACTALMAALAAPAHAEDSLFEASFDSAFGTELREPVSFEAIYETKFEEQIADLANGSRGRIGVYAIDLASGEEVAVLGDMRFPMASTSKVAVAATFLAGVDEGKYSLTSEYPLMIPIRSKKFSSDKAPVKEGNYVPAYELISLMISKSCNSCTDALLKVVGGPEK